MTSPKPGADDEESRRPRQRGVLGMGKGGSMAPLAAPPPSGKLERLGAE